MRKNARRNVIRYVIRWESSFLLFIYLSSLQFVESALNTRMEEEIQEFGQKRPLEQINKVGWGTLFLMLLMRYLNLPFIIHFSLPSDTPKTISARNPSYLPNFFRRFSWESSLVFSIFRRIKKIKWDHFLLLLTYHSSFRMEWIIWKEFSSTSVLNWHIQQYSPFRRLFLFSHLFILPSLQIHAFWLSPSSKRISRWSLSRICLLLCEGPSPWSPFSLQFFIR